MKARPLNKKYGLNKHEFYIVYHHCLRYSDYKEELESMTVLKSLPIGSGGGTRKNDTTADLVIRKVELERYVTDIEECAWKAVDANKVIYPYLLRYVTTEQLTFEKLKGSGLPCERTYFYCCRRRFYFLMSKKIKVRTMGTK